MKLWIGILVAAILITAGGAAYYFGKQASKPAGDEVITQQETINTEQVLETETGNTKTVSGGGILSFPRYELTIPNDWTDKREVPMPDSEKITLTKGEYKIQIDEGAFGGMACLYPEDPDLEGESVRYQNFIDIIIKSGEVIRRSWTGGGGYTICQQTQNGWFAPTMIGHISITTPDNYDPDMVEEIDTIMGSLTII